jgi:hypothetical protein
MKFSVFDVMDKGLYLKQTLEAAGHEPVRFEDADVLILDCDWAWADPRPQLIDEAVARGLKVALYPHGGMPTVHVYDGLTKPHPGVDLRLEHGVGSIDIAEHLDLDLRQAAPGWLYCPTLPFSPIEDPQRILFAPLHPNIEAMNAGENGPDPAPHLNRDVYRQLLEFGFDLTVSVVGPLWRNGLWAHPRATMVSNNDMRFTHAYELIQNADVVVAAGTIAAAAVACGKPTVLLGGHDCSDYIRGEYVRADHADDYQDWLAYPFNVEDAFLADLILDACAGSVEASAWRERWISDDGAAAAVRALEHLVGEDTETSRHVAICGVTARAQGS